MKSLDDVLQGIDDALDESVARLFELLRFPSVGTDPAYRGACRDTAAWLKRLLAEMGFAARMDETTGQQVIVAEYAPKGLPSHAPRILFFGHYAVKPPAQTDLREIPHF